MLTADNLLYLLEVSRTRRVADAAKRLGVDHTTVSRRIDRLERQLQVRLFDRGATGWQVTEAGARLLPYAKSLESTMRGAVDAIHGTTDGAIAGTARIATPDGFGSYVLIPGLPPLRREHPGLEVELVTSTTHDLVAARDYDVAVTLETPSPRAVSVTKLADYRLRLYASREYLADMPPLTDLPDLRHCSMIWYVDAFLDVEPLRELGAMIPGFHAAIQTNNITGQHHAVRCGLGIAPLPTYIGEADETLVAVLPDRFTVNRSYWLVVPRELARLTRVRAVCELLRSIVSAHPELAQGT